MKKQFLIILVFVFVLIASGCNLPWQSSIMCSEDLKKCPDGSYVGRIGSKCEFKACPSVDINAPIVTDFNSCAAAGNPIMESYPRQCRAADGRLFVEVINNNINEPSQRPCTMEAKLCPDGSYVGRTGPNCEFSPCPGQTEDKSVSCQVNSGNWLAEYQECKNISQEWCQQQGGMFNACESACRHNQQAEMCIEVCVPVCKF